MVSNGRKYIIDISSAKKFAKIWVFHGIKIDSRKNSAVIQTSNSGKLTKIIKNMKNAQKIWQN